jgi:hypothetical protein
MEEGRMEEDGGGRRRKEGGGRRRRKEEHTRMTTSPTEVKAIQGHLVVRVACHWTTIKQLV